MAIKDDKDEVKEVLGYRLYDILNLLGLQMEEEFTDISCDNYSKVEKWSLKNMEKLDGHLQYQRT